MYFCIKQAGYLLEGHSFILQTDHNNIKWLEKSVVPKIVRWQLALAEYDFTMEHIPGRLNDIADTLSRIPAINMLTNIGNNIDFDLLLQQKQCNKIISYIHNTTIGHRGIHATLKLLHSLGLIGDNINNDVKNYITSCATCQKNSKVSSTNIPSIYHLSTTEPFQILSIDIIGPLSPDKDNYKYILVIIDNFTRFTELVRLKDVTAIGAAHALISIFDRYGSPSSYFI